MQQAPSMEQTTSLLQSALTPAFLLVALGSMLPVFTGRMARIVDRSRDLMAEYAATEGPEHEQVVNELRDLEKRITTVNLAIGLNVLSAIIVSVLIGILFLNGMGFFQLDALAGIIFFIAILLMAASLITFLMEVQLAVKNLRIREEFLERPSKTEARRR
jgi:hypothetical protein